MKKLLHIILFGIAVWIFFILSYWFSNFIGALFNLSFLITSKDLIGDRIAGLSTGAFAMYWLCYDQISLKKLFLK